jgi:hypothetical protein
MAATRKEQQMNSLTRNGILRICLTTAAALALAAPAGAHNASMVARYGWGAAATVAKRQSSDLVAQYGWGAAATYAKQQEGRSTLAAQADGNLLTRYGWGAAAAYAKLHA